MLELSGTAVAGIVLAVLGWLAYQARGLGRWVWDALRRRCVTRLTVTDDHQQFPALLGWLSRRMPDHREVQPANIGSDRLLPAGASPQRSTGVRMAPGSTWFWLGRRPCWVTYTRADTASGGRSRPVETLSLTFLSRDPNTPTLVLAQAEAEADEPGTVQAMFQQGYSLPVHRIQSRPIGTVNLPGDQAADLLDDARQFFRSAAVYQRRGVPHRRGYLLEGPPGTGKTSLAVALATELRLPLVVLALGDTFDQQLAELMRQVPAGGAVILIEDIDCASAAGSRTHWVRDGRSDSPEMPGRLSLSGLLNSLDGVSAPTNVLVVFTTNHPEKLDPALVRPGRVDRRVSFGPVTADQAHAMWDRFFPEAMGGAAFGVEMARGKKTAAEVQQELMRTGEVASTITATFDADRLPVLNYPASMLVIQAPEDVPIKPGTLVYGGAKCKRCGGLHRLLNFADDAPKAVGKCEVCNLLCIPPCDVCGGKEEIVFAVDGRECREPCATCRPIAAAMARKKQTERANHANVPPQNAHGGSHSVDRAEHPRRDGLLPVSGGDEQPPARR